MNSLKSFVMLRSKSCGSSR